MVEPGADAIALAALYARSRITIDDSSTVQNPAALVHPGNGEPFSLENSFRGGDTVTGITGVIDHSFGLYRVHPTAYGEYTVENPRPAAPAVGGEIQVASFNVLNYFLNLDLGRPASAARARTRSAAVRTPRRSGCGSGPRSWRPSPRSTPTSWA